MASEYTTLVGKKRIRVYYHLEPTGKEYFNLLSKDYFRISGGVKKLLDSPEGADIIDKEDLYKKDSLPNEVSNTYIKNLNSAYIIKRIKCLTISISCFYPLNDIWNQNLSYS